LTVDPGEGAARRKPLDRDNPGLNANAALALGCEILDPVLALHGFAFEPRASGSPNGETFARGAYVRLDRRLELGFKQSLAVVIYQVGTLVLTHDSYMQAVLGPAGSNMYPSFTGDPLDGFRHLRHDLESYAGVFLHGPPEHFRQIVERAGKQAAQTARTTLYRL
jgi:hypothetical protein